MTLPLYTVSTSKLRDIYMTIQNNAVGC